MEFPSDLAKEFEVLEKLSDHRTGSIWKVRSKSITYLVNGKANTIKVFNRMNPELWDLAENERIKLSGIENQFIIHMHRKIYDREGRACVLMDCFDAPSLYDNILDMPVIIDILKKEIYGIIFIKFLMRFWASIRMALFMEISCQKSSLAGEI